MLYLKEFYIETDTKFFDINQRFHLIYNNLVHMTKSHLASLQLIL